MRHLKRKHFHNPFDEDNQQSAADILAEYRNKGEQTIISCMSAIIKCMQSEPVVDNGLIEAMKEELDYVSGKLGIDFNSVLLLSIIIEESSTGRGCDGDDICRTLGWTSMEFLGMADNLNKMLKMRMICIDARMGMNYRVSPKLLEVIKDNGIYKAPCLENLSCEEFFMALREEMLNFIDGKVKFDFMMDNIKDLVHLNAGLAFCDKVIEMLGLDVADHDLAAFFYLCNRYANFNEVNIDIDRFEKFYEPNNAFPQYRSLQLGKSILQKGGLVEFCNMDGFKDTSMITLTDEIKNDWLSDVEFVEPEVSNKSRKDLISSDSIQHKELFYNPNEGEMVNRLHSLLEEENFDGIQKRLEEQGMRRGFNCIFYGAPGTGKTASVYELARRSGRDIFPIDVSKIKSKWVGDSEKSMKAVFDTYKELCGKSGKAPILLFNEADAIFGKRNDNPEHSADKMNNSIQNILLQGMEDLDGILIATTNLEGSLDPAFERRFIYKVKFEMPGEDSRAKMWKSIIPEIKDEDSLKLARAYGFSGGQIENIARKNAVEYVLSGEGASFEKLDKFCREEMFSKQANRSKVGFKNM